MPNLYNFKGLILIIGFAVGAFTGPYFTNAWASYHECADIGTYEDATSERLKKSIEFSNPKDEFCGWILVDALHTYWSHPEANDGATGTWEYSCI